MKQIFLVTLLAGALTSQAQIYFLDASNDTLSRVDLNGNNRVDIVNGLNTVPYGLTIDQDAGKLYWSRIGSGSNYLQRSNLDGTNVETLYTFSGDGEYGAIMPAGLLLDTTNEFIYFNDIANDKLWRAAINGGGAAQMAEMVNFRTFTGSFTGSNEAYGIASHDGASLTFTLSYSAIDGVYNTATGNLAVNDDAGAITADPISGKYYYTTFGAVNGIYSMDFNGANNTLLLDNLSFVAGGGGITVHDSRIYWTEQGSVLGDNAIWRANLDGTNATKLYENTVGASGYIYGIVVVPEPRTYALLAGFAVLGLALIHRRKRAVYSRC